MKFIILYLTFNFDIRKFTLKIISYNYSKILWNDFKENHLYLLRKEIIFFTLYLEYQIDGKLIFSTLRSYEKKYYISSSNYVFRWKKKKRIKCIPHDLSCKRVEAVQGRFELKSPLRISLKTLGRTERTNCQAKHVCSLITRTGRVRTPFRTSPKPSVHRFVTHRIGLQFT